MAKPRVLVLRAPGTNCDVETAFAFEQAGAEAVSIHVQHLIERPILASNFQILCFPGGFSYGDDIAAGRVLAAQLNVHLRDSIEGFRSDDRLVLGICNGFQIMMRLGIFFENSVATPPATLAWNAQGRFEDRWVHLKNCNHDSPFLRGFETIYLPMAHAEGRFVIRDDQSASRLIENRQVALRYCDATGETSDEVLPYPTNPNGAALNLAGLCDESGRVFGLMPHPERHIFATQHPFWTRRRSQPEHGEGIAIFQNAVAFFQ